MGIVTGCVLVFFGVAITLLSKRMAKWYAKLYPKPTIIFNGICDGDTNHGCSGGILDACWGLDYLQCPWSILNQQWQAMVDSS
jgi:hypothetical protein